MQYGGKYEYSPFKDEFVFGGIGQDQLGRRYIQAVRGSLELVGEVGDENGTPIFDLLGDVLQPDKVPRNGERVRYLKFSGKAGPQVVCLVRNPQPWDNAQTSYVHSDEEIVGEVEREGRALRLRGPDIRFAIQTKFYDAAGVAFEPEEIDNKIAVGEEIRVVGEWKSEVVLAQRIDVGRTNNGASEHPIWYFSYAGRKADGSLQTLDDEYVRVALDARIIDAESGIDLPFSAVQPGMPVEVERRWCNAPSFWNTDDLRYRDLCGAITSLVLNASVADEVQVFNEWSNSGLFARVEEDLFGSELVMFGPAVRVDENTRIEDAEGLAIDLGELRPGQKVCTDLTPTRDPMVALALSVQVWDPQHQDQSDPTIYVGTVDGTEGELIYFEGRHYPLSSDTKMQDESGNSVGAEALTAGQCVQLLIQNTSTGERLSRVQMLDGGPHFESFREEDVPLFGIDPSGRVVFGGTRATVVPRPEGSAFGTEILDRDGRSITLEELRELVRLTPELRVILSSHTSLSSDREVALYLRVFDANRPLEDQMRQGAELGSVGAIEAGEIQLVDRSRFIHLAHNAEIAWRDRIVAVGEIPPLTPVRLHGVVAPADYSQMFGHIVTRIEVDPEVEIFAHLSSPEGGSSPNADFDGDGQVGFGDFFRFADAFGRADFNPLFDLDEDGQVGFGDFFIFSDLFGQGAAKALVKAPLSQVDGSLLLEVRSEDGEVVVDLRSVDVQLSGYGAVVEYDAAVFHLVEVTDARSALAQRLRLTREGYGEVQIAGSATGSGQSAGGLLVQLRFAPLAVETAGLFRIREALVRDAAGRMVELRHAGGFEARLQPSTFALLANYPNPFNPSTIIPFQLPETVQTTLSIYDVLGQKVRTLAEGMLLAGHHQSVWDGRDDAGRQLAGGMYFYHLEAGDFSGTNKLLLVR